MEIDLSIHRALPILSQLLKRTDGLHSFGICSYALDPDALHHIAQHGIDAARVLFLDCDDGECSMVEGVHAFDGWHFENKLGGVYESKNSGHTSQILMMEMEDTE